MNELRALTMWQPWASLFVSQEKQWETRPWDTALRGELAIHAARYFPRKHRRLCEQEPFKSALARIGIASSDDLPRGCVIGVVKIIGTVPANTLDSGLGRLPRGEHELFFGDFDHGRFAWRHANGAIRLAEPIFTRGWQRIWILPTDIERQVRSQMEAAKP